MGRVLIVGGGAAGLAAALFMRRLGHEAVVFEKLPHTAPLLRGFMRRGLHFDTGFHYAGGLGDGILSRYLNVLGLDRYLERVPLSTTDGEIVRFSPGRGDFPIARGRDAFAATIAGAFPGAAEKLPIFFDKIEEYARYSPFLNPDGEGFDPHRLFEESITLDAFFDELGLPPRLRLILGFRCLLYGVHPAYSRLRDFSLVNAAYIDDAAAITGGGRALAEAFDLALAEAGAEVRTGVEVVGIDLGGGNSVKSVKIRRHESGDVEDVPGDMCLYCGAPAALPDLLPPGALRPVFANRLLNLKETDKPFIMFGVTTSEFFRHRQLFSCPDDSFDPWFPGQNCPASANGRSPAYVSGGDGLDGRYPVAVLTTIPPEATARWKGGGLAADRSGYREFKEKTSEALRHQLLEDCPEFGGTLEIIESATDVSMRHWSFNSSGSLYGKIHGTVSSPVLPVTRINGLALAGQNIILPGLLGVTVSAAVAAGSLVGNNRVLELLQ